MSQCKATIGVRTPVEVLYDYWPPIKGRTTGPADFCEEPQPEQFEIVSVRLGPHDVWPYLSEQDCFDITDQVRDAFHKRNP